MLVRLYSWELLVVLVLPYPYPQVLSCGAGLNFNQQVIGYPRNIHATIVPEGIPRQTTYLLL